MERASAEQRGMPFFWDPGGGAGVCGTEEERTGKVASMILLYVGTYNPLSLIAIKIGIESIGTY